MADEVFECRDEAKKSSNSFSINTSNESSNYHGMIRPKKDLIKEYITCINPVSRLNQVYMDGKLTSCWLKWGKYLMAVRKMERKNNDTKKKSYMEEAMKYELSRRELRQKDHLQNTVWEYRDSPPTDWNEPLPEFMAAREGTPLHHYQKLWEQNKLPTFS